MALGSGREHKDVSEKKEGGSGDGEKPKDREDETFVAGLAEGFLTTLIHPFRWFRSIVGKVKD